MNPYYRPEDSEDGIPTYRFPEEVMVEIARAERLDRFEDIPIFE